MNESGEQIHYSEQSEIETQKTFEVQMNGVKRLSSPDFQNNFLEALSEINRPDIDGMIPAIKMAELQGEYVRALLDISGGIDCPSFKNIDQLNVWNESVRNIMFDTSDPTSLASKAESVVKNADVHPKFVGATSTLTFMDLWQDVYPEEVNVYMQVTDAETDAKRKIDLAVETPTTITLVQLKTNKEDAVSIIPVTEIRPYLGGKVSEKDVVKMLIEQKRRQSAQLQMRVEDPTYSPKRVSVMIAEVPSIDSDCVGNVFGKITDTDIRAKLVNEMRDQAIDKKVIPKPIAA